MPGRTKNPTDLVRNVEPKQRSMFIPAIELETPDLQFYTNSLWAS